MEMSNKAYQNLAERLAPKSNTPLNCVKAFVIGGGICALGQAQASRGEQDGKENGAEK